MNRFYLTWTLVQLKSTFKHVTFYLVTVLASVILILSDAVFAETKEDIEVLICTNDTRIGNYVLDYLDSHSPDGYSFIGDDNEEKIKNSVVRSDVSCGVVFSETTDSDIYEFLGMAENTHKKDSLITIYQNADMPEGYLMEEILFPVIQRSVADEWLEGYLPTEAKETSKKQYNELLNTMNLNLSEVIYVDKTGVMKSHSDNKDEFGGAKMAVFALIAALVIGFGIADQRGVDRGFYLSLPEKNRSVLKLIKILVLTVPALVLSLAIYLLYLNLIK